MTAPFTASNDYLVVPHGEESGAVARVQSDELYEVCQYVSSHTLRALVEYAATIGITAEPSEETSA